MTANKTQNKPSSPLMRPTIQFFVATGLFVVTILASREAPLTSWEKELFQLIYGWPGFLWLPFVIVTQLGSVYVFALLTAFYTITRRYRAAIEIVLAGTLAYVVSGVAKELWGRVRPHDILPDVISLEFSVYGPGFPSGHTALATALLLTAMHHLPQQYRWLPIVGIIGVGLSRVYLGVHAPLDIIGGFAIGWGMYALVRRIQYSSAAAAKSRAQRHPLYKNTIGRLSQTKS